MTAVPAGPADRIGKGIVMIEAHELTKRHGEETAVDDMSFTIA